VLQLTDLNITESYRELTINNEKGDEEEAIAQSKGKMVVMQDEYANSCSQS
jgi:hypothetical protein